MIGTKGVGYIESDIPRRCGTCKYAVERGSKLLCRQKEAVEDGQMKTDAATELKIVQPVKGCCNEWEPSNWRDVAKAKKE